MAFPPSRRGLSRHPSVSPLVSHHLLLLLRSNHRGRRSLRARRALSRWLARSQIVNPLPFPMTKATRLIETPCSVFQILFLLGLKTVALALAMVAGSYDRDRYLDASNKNVDGAAKRNKCCMGFSKRCRSRCNVFCREIKLLKDV